MYYTYVLISKCGKRTYTGHTANLDKRLSQHNKGEVKSSNKYRPYEVLFYEIFATLKLAKERELFYKTSTGRYQLRKIINQSMLAAKCSGISRASQKNL